GGAGSAGGPARRTRTCRRCPGCRTCRARPGWPAAGRRARRWWRRPGARSPVPSVPPSPASPTLQVPAVGPPVLDPQLLLAALPDRLLPLPAADRVRAVRRRHRARRHQGQLTALAPLLEHLAAVGAQRLVQDLLAQLEDGVDEHLGPGRAA